MQFCCGKGPKISFDDWFDACISANLPVIQKYKDLFMKQTDTRKTQYKNLNLPSFVINEEDCMDFRVPVSYKFQVKITGFCGLMYAILYDNFDVINLLLDELMCTCAVACAIPVSYSTDCVMTESEAKLFLPLNITQIVRIPKNSTILELCLYLNKLKLFGHLMQRVYKLPLAYQHKLMQFEQTSLILQLMRIPDSFEEFEKHSQFLIEYQFDFESETGENCTFVAAETGNPRYLEFFLSLCWETRYYEIVKEQIDQIEYGRDLVETFSRNREQPKYQKCLKLYKNFLQQIYPDPPPFVTKNDKMSIVIENVRETLEEIETTGLNYLNKYSKSVFDERNSLNQPQINQISVQFRGEILQNQGNQSKDEHKESSSVIVKNESSSEIQFQGKVFRKSSIAPRFVVDQNGQTVIQMDPSQEKTETTSSLDKQQSAQLLENSSVTHSERGTSERTTQSQNEEDRKNMKSLRNKHF